MARPLTSGLKSISTAVLPDRYRSIFKFPAFNDMQSLCFSTLYQDDVNTVISSPTGSGKTVLFELAMLRTLVANNIGNFKIIYIAPTKSLCYERFQDWSARLAVLGVKCGFLTGDTSAEEIATVKQADVIITTPEKWDSTTRRWTDYDRLMTIVKLVLIDEVHILKDLRGATLEVVVSRMKYIAPHARFIALSATIPNAEDIAEWLGQQWNSRSIPAQLFAFGEEFRPVQLDIHVYGYPARTTNTFQLDKLYDSKLPEILDAHFAQKPIIIFCPTRKSTVSTAKLLAKTWMKSREAILSCRMDPGRHFQDNELDELSRAGVAYHHAGLSMQDRVMVERMFLGRKILIICCTSTLSVNLPAQLVIIRGTSAWIEGQVQEYTEFDMHQMMGRAGRPQFDTSGVAVIMTTRDKQSKYEQILCGQEVVESCLHNHLVEHLNAEVCLRTINDIESAKGWLRSTFLYVRMKKNPAHYNIGATGSSKTIEESLDHLCTENIARLQTSKIVETSDGNVLVPTTYGKSMALFYIQFQTMLNFMNAGVGMSISDILNMLVQSNEFKNIRFKQGEKKFYKEINASVGIRYPLKTADIKDSGEKVSLIIQFTLGRPEFPAYDGSGKHITQFHSDKAIVWQHVQRLIRCIVDCKIQALDALSVRNALELARSLQAEIWDNSSNILLQLEGVGPATLRKFLNRDVRTFADLAGMDSLSIESALSLNRGRGMKYLQDVEKMPRFEVSLKKLRETPDTSSVKITIQVAVKLMNKTVVKMYNRKLLTVGFLVELSNGELVDFRRAM
ncbi:Sec63 Brl domain-containing protein [Lipomyces tetrasporus]|uniref:DNA 3'-5' helicase n=1 Tax=Lipomyces tetrasporus TaxID=54092 RepID=A0AAD7QVK2_9ASCO|nr:Sec63 Brl domain-containing protein [Lipomyces tetrasporus]KAJ8100562.1 Sec63 Brl domain-containing protein [Lipomyces tetrasporus]